MGAKKKQCGAECEECVICKGQKLCCLCSHSGYHACVKKKREPATAPKGESE